MPRNGHQRPKTTPCAIFLEYDETHSVEERNQRIMEINKQLLKIWDWYKKRLDDEEHRKASTIGIGFDTTRKPPKAPLVLFFKDKEWARLKKRKQQQEKRQRDRYKELENTFQNRLKEYKEIKRLKRELEEFKNEIKPELPILKKEYILYQEMLYIIINEFRAKDINTQELNSAELEELLKTEIENLQKKISKAAGMESGLLVFKESIDKMESLLKPNQTGGEK